MGKSSKNLMFGKMSGDGCTLCDLSSSLSALIERKNSPGYCAGVTETDSVASSERISPSSGRVRQHAPDSFEAIYLRQKNREKENSRISEFGGGVFAS